MTFSIIGLISFALLFLGIGVIVGLEIGERL